MILTLTNDRMTSSSRTNSKSTAVELLLVLHAIVGLGPSMVILVLTPYSFLRVQIHSKHLGKDCPTLVFL